ncbi:MAG TPA: phospholipase C, phosphocholine-specific [Mycobacteriales bacterium]|nr:phospholipase C, phosphocholine-specific [Mycobacteriales bacterium]
MVTVDRRTFLKLAGVPALGAALPVTYRQALDKALAVPAHNRTGSLEDVEHVVFLTQENRAFDHYFGTLRGVRGFNDPHPVTLPSGKSVWHQPGVDGTGELLPYRPDVPDVGRMFLPDPPHGWADTHAAWNGGRHDDFPPNKGVQTMTYHTREDLPFPFALAEAFTVCDNYHCSLLGPTDPNRYHLWTGWVGNDGAAGGPVVTNAEAGYDWTTYPERLQRAGVSWRVYQDAGLGLDAAGVWGFTQDPFIGNFGDNSLLYFHQYQNAAPGDPLFDRARVGTHAVDRGRSPDALLTDFRADVERGRLPQVSWIVAPEAYSEHPNWEPDFGSWYTAQVVDILASNPSVWSKTVLFVTYDEEGGFFDHLVPPTPPASPAQGISTVPVTNEIFPGAPGLPAGPYGLGMRVPMIVVSPWSRGGWVNSQLFDHTSLIRFLERRFGPREDNITPWRRAVVGDLTSTFDFRRPNRQRAVRLPDTDDFKPEDLTRRPDQVPVPPADQRVPRQERGVRPARAIPYTLHADARRTGGTVTVELASGGAATGVFQLRLPDAPRSYTVQRGRRVSDSVDAAGPYDLAVHGPNGFFRGFTGGAPGRPELDVRATYDEDDTGISLRLRNPGRHRLQVTVRDGYGSRPRTRSLGAGEAVTERWSLARSRGWYDLVVTVQGEAHFRRRYAGHVETGDDSITDPQLGGLT